jgi:hypothetical protein
MKLLSLELGVFLFVIGVAIFGNTEVWGADWKFWYEEIVKDHDGSNFKRVYYYDRESIVRPSKGIVKVWVKDVDQRDKISLKERKEDLDKSYEKDWEEFQRITKQEESRLGRKVYPNDKYSFQKMREELAMPHCIKYTMKSYQFNCSERTCCQYLEFRQRRSSVIWAQNGP